MVSGRPISTGSRSSISGSARKIASQRPVGLRLHGVAEGRRVGRAAVVFQNVGLARRDHEADPRGAAEDQPLHQVIADGARTAHLAVVAVADGQQFFGKRERLDAAAFARCWNNAPHVQTSSVADA